MGKNNSRFDKLAENHPALARALKQVDGAHPVGTSLSHHVLSLDQRISAYQDAVNVIINARAQRPTAPFEDLHGYDQIRSQKSNLLTHMRTIKGYLSMCAEESFHPHAMSKIPSYADENARLRQNPDETYSLTSFMHENNSALRTVAAHWDVLVEKLPRKIRTEHAHEWDMEWDYDLKEEFPINPDHEEAHTYGIEDEEEPFFSPDDRDYGRS